MSPTAKTTMLLAATASVDVRTAQRFLLGTPIRGRLALERLQRAAAELGIQRTAPMVPAPSVLAISALPRAT